VKALLRIAVVWNIPVACNRASADFMIASPLMTGAYQPASPNYHRYTGRMNEQQPEKSSIEETSWKTSKIT